MTNNEEILYRLKSSPFRARFHLSNKDKEYIKTKGIETIRSHAYDFINKRLAPKVIPNDGKQTPMRGHPVFVAQHACACCCRGCLEKWHHIPNGNEMTNKQVDYAVDLIMDWINKEMENE